MTSFMLRVDSRIEGRTRATLFVAQGVSEVLANSGSFMLPEKDFDTFVALLRAGSHCIADADVRVTSNIPQPLIPAKPWSKKVH